MHFSSVFTSDVITNLLGCPKRDYSRVSMKKYKFKLRVKSSLSLMNVSTMQGISNLYYKKKLQEVTPRWRLACKRFIKKCSWE